MDPIKSAQDVSRCDICEDALVQMYCDYCHVNLCISCIGNHISDDYDKHKVVPFQHRLSTLIYTKCSTHQTKLCKFHCKECNICVCSFCSIVSDEHKGHSIATLSDIYNTKREAIEKDTHEIENVIFPTYDEAATDLETQIANLDAEYEKLTSEVTEHGEKIIRVNNSIVDKMKTEIKEQKIKHMSILQRHLDEIKDTHNRFNGTLLTLKRIEESNEVSLTMEYISQINRFSYLPPKLHVLLPIFSPNSINTDQFYRLFGTLTQSSTTTEENGNIMQTVTPSKEFVKEPELIATLEIGYMLKIPQTTAIKLLEEAELIITIKTGYETLRSVSCFGEDEIWTRGQVDDMKCFNLHDSIMKIIKTKSGEPPHDITIRRDGNLVYSDWKTSTVNKVINDKTEEIVKLQGWIPSQLCITSSGDLLVTMYSTDQCQSKVVRYSDSTEKQTIQFDDEGKPLYSGNAHIKYITENRNMDICVADSKGYAVVVVNQIGRLRFRYTGHHPTPQNKPFRPYMV